MINIKEYSNGILQINGYDYPPDQLYSANLVLPDLISKTKTELTNRLFIKILQSYWPRYCRIASQGWPHTTYQPQKRLSYHGYHLEDFTIQKSQWLSYTYGKYELYRTRFGWPRYYLSYSNNYRPNACSLWHFRDHCFSNIAGLALYKYYSNYALKHDGLIGKARKPFFEYPYTGKSGKNYSDHYWHTLIDLINNDEPYLTFLNGIFRKLTRLLHNIHFDKFYDDVCYMSSHQGFVPRISRKKYKEFIYFIDCIPLQFDEPNEMLKYLYNNIITYSEKAFVKTALTEPHKRPSQKSKPKHNQKRPLKQFPWRDL